MNFHCRKHGDNTSGQLFDKTLEEFYAICDQIELNLVRCLQYLIQAMLSFLLVLVSFISYIVVKFTTVILIAVAALRSLCFCVMKKYLKIVWVGLLNAFK